MPIDDFPPGTRVRPRRCPDRTGTVTPADPRLWNDKWSVQIKFDGGQSSWIKIEQLEVLQGDLDPEKDLKAGVFYPVSVLRRQLLHEKLNGKLSNILYSMDTADTKFFAYQFKPVFKLIESPTNGILIADEVGLGKTIETGLIWTELRARSAARNILIVCPPHLRLKFQSEFKRRFGVKLRLAQADDLEKELLEWKRDKGHTFALVCSYHSLRPKRGWEEENPTNHRNASVRLAHLLQELANEQEPPVDMLGMDEVHYMRNPTTASSALGDLLCPISAYRVFLSATPIHTTNDNLFTLLKLLDPDTYTDIDTFRGILSANEPLVRLRDLIINQRVTKGELIEKIDGARQNPMLQDSLTLQQIRDQIEDASDLSESNLRMRLAYQLERANLLSSSYTRSRKRDVFAKEDIVLRDPQTLKVQLHPLEMELYEKVNAIIAKYVEGTTISASFLGVMPQRQISSCAAAALSRWRGLDTESDGSKEGETDDDLPEEVRGPLIEFLCDHLPTELNPQKLKEVDSKYQKLLHFFQGYWKQNPGKKIILFAFFKPTLRYLNRRLRSDGISSMLLHGGIKIEKQEVIDQFKSDPNVNLLLSSEVGGEGLDLQFASTLINYDLPWNPMVVEQRIGRIDRIGQKEPRIQIVNMIAEGTVDERIFDRLYDRLDLFRAALGDLGDILGPLVSDLQKDLLHGLNAEQEEERIIIAEQALAQKLIQHEQMEQEAAVLAGLGDYLIDQIQGRHQRKQWIKTSDIEVFVTEFLRSEFPKTRLQGIDPQIHLFEIELDAETAHRLNEFLKVQRGRSETRITNCRPNKIRFEHKTYKDTDRNYEIIHQSHPLVRFACSWLRDENKIQSEPVAVSLPAKNLHDIRPGVYAYIVQLWKVKGIKSHETLSYHAWNYEDKSKLSENLAEQLVEGAVSGYNWTTAPQELEEEAQGSRLKDLIGEIDEYALRSFADYEERCVNENGDRCRIQLNAIERFRERKETNLRETLEKHQAHERIGLIAATEELIRKHRALCDSRKLDVTKKKEILAENTTIARGVIKVT